METVNRMRYEGTMKYSKMVATLARLLAEEEIEHIVYYESTNDWLIVCVFPLKVKHIHSCFHTIRPGDLLSDQWWLK